ncbi:flavodoxin [Ruminococcus bovis]|uniref:Flavodoxin n=1 Tax=Ruminococcus bovis TaxID=2564099 RepID=A0A4P8Y319_9FIRM|nr:flavodoxin [Ruminococcus bovis]QCT07718.1 flavodoxin [Ruminococcus bovis]
MSKNLIIYYSRKGENYVNGNIVSLKKGNTEICAEYISNAVGGDLFEVETVNEYSENYTQCTKEAKDEFNSNARPELKKYLDSIEEYDNIFICGPCWWGTYPMAVFSLIEKLDFNGKNVLPLMTHEGSGLGNSVNDLKKICIGANVKAGLAIHGAESENSESKVTSWAKKSIDE